MSKRGRHTQPDRIPESAWRKPMVGGLAVIQLAVVLQACLHTFTVSAPPTVVAFAPAGTGIITRVEPGSPSGTVYTLDDGAVVEAGPSARSVFSTAGEVGDLLAFGSDDVGSWVSVFHRVGDQRPCFTVIAELIDAGPDVLLDRYRFPKAPGFSTAFPTAQGDRYPAGRPCLDRELRVVSID